MRKEKSVPEHHTPDAGAPGEPDEVPEVGEALATAITRIREERRSLVSATRLRHLVQLVRERPTGALVECGVGRGGALALMAAAARPDQPVWGFDSFQAMPELTDPDEGDGQAWVGVRVTGNEGARAVSVTFDLIGQSLENVHVVEGWFDESLPATLPEIGPIAILRLDNDWYASTLLCLEQLYDSVLPGGVVIVDDYFTFRGCRRATDEFRAARRIRSPMVTVEPASEAYWIA